MIDHAGFWSGPPELPRDDNGNINFVNTTFVLRPGFNVQKALAEINPEEPINGEALVELARDAQALLWDVHAATLADGELSAHFSPYLCDCVGHCAMNLGEPFYGEPDLLKAWIKYQIHDAWSADEYMLDMETSGDMFRTEDQARDPVLRQFRYDLARAMVEFAEEVRDGQH